MKYFPASHKASANLNKSFGTCRGPAATVPPLRRIHEMSTRSVAVVLICGFTSLLLAQAPPAPPQPGPEHKKLESLVGRWTAESEIKANEYVPAGKGVSTQTCTLGPGGFYIECLAEGQTIPRTFAI